MNGPIISSSLAKQSNPEEHNFFISEVNKAIKDVSVLLVLLLCFITADINFKRFLLT